MKWRPGSNGPSTCVPEARSDETEVYNGSDKRENDEAGVSEQEVTTFRSAKILYRILSEAREVTVDMLFVVMHSMTIDLNEFSRRCCELGTAESQQKVQEGR